MKNISTYILDTSVLLYNASSMRSFGSKNVVIPYPVLEELDRFKSREGEIGKNARQVVRELNELRKAGNLSEGVEVTPKGGILTVVLHRNSAAEPSLDFSIADDRILGIALQLKNGTSVHGTVSEVVLVTKDINLAVKAEALGLEARNFNSDKLVESASDLYQGTAEIGLPSDMLDMLASGGLETSEVSEFCGIELLPNQYLTLSSLEDPSRSILGRAGWPAEKIKMLKSVKPAWGLLPRNREQRFAFDAVMDQKIQLVTLTGQAGTGKSVLGIAAALYQVHDLQLYDRLIVSRPIQAMGNDIGYLPGDLEAKLSPWMGPIKDSISFLSQDSGRNGNEMYDHMIETGMLEVEALTYIRGRSIPNSLFILDEAQNLSKAEVKAIISRMGEGSKIIITGDVQQIDNPYLDATSTGLASVIEKFKGEKISAHINLKRGERSTLATLASIIL